MEEAEGIRISRVGPHTIRLGPPPEVCDACDNEPPFVAFENPDNEKVAWLCETCLEKGYPDIYSDMMSIDEIQKCMITVPWWSKGEGRGS